MAKQSKEIPVHIAKQLKLIGERVGELRRDSDKVVTLEDINATRMTLWRIENGKDAQLSTLLQILDAYDISPKEFFKDIPNGH